MKKILFISHEASLSGAPLILLYLLKWLNSNTQNMQFDLLLLKGGLMVSDFKKECTNTYVYSDLHRPLKFSEILAQKVLSRLNIKQNKDKLFLKNMASHQYDLIYANTVVSLEKAAQIKELSPNNPALIAHIHELNVFLRAFELASNRKALINHYIAASKLVKNNLLEQWNLSDKKVSVVYEFSKISLPSDSQKTEKRVFTVGASGHVHWRKGHDLYIQVARYIKTHFNDKEIVFKWVGEIATNEKLIIEEDLRKLGLQNSVHFVGQQSQPHIHFEEFDVFLMTSREDPFPLVCIEVGMMGKPIICFDQATGTQEILDKGGGKIVPYLNIEKMSEAIVAYYDNKDLLAQDSQLIKKAFENFTPENQCPEIYKILTSQI